MNTTKYSFKNDYSELVAPEILDAFSKVGNKQLTSYGEDEYSIRAGDLIREKIKNPNAGVYFVGGGTHANLIVISSLLRPFEAAVAPDSGHISLFETGAIEATGHKVCNVKNHNGKLTAKDVENVVIAHYDEHMVRPRLVYISQSTEHGTIYKKAELEEISGYCRENGLFLFMDGARLASAMCSSACDMTYSELSHLVDAFVMGGTKNGMLFGDAIVICKEELNRDFRYLVKQRGALFSKGAAIGVQFETMMSDGLYEKFAQKANKTAAILAEGIKALGYEFLYPFETNQVFPIFPVKTLEQLWQKYEFYEWEKLGDKSAARLIASWATPPEKAEEFLELLKTL